jgi:hypothetical protein
MLLFGLMDYFACGRFQNYMQLSEVLRRPDIAIKAEEKWRNF